MAEKAMYPNTEGGFVGHDEATSPAPRAPFLDSPAVHAPLDQSGGNSVNSKNSFGTNGIPEGGGE
jgi:hypothetical protein